LCKISGDKLDTRDKYLIMHLPDEDICFYQ
jgi:hypothetical protein